MRGRQGRIETRRRRRDDASTSPLLALLSPRLSPCYCLPACPLTLARPSALAFHLSLSSSPSSPNTAAQAPSLAFHGARWLDPPAALAARPAPAGRGERHDVRFKFERIDDRLVEYGVGCLAMYVAFAVSPCSWPGPRRL
jgi:hypothetical protein